MADNSERKGKRDAKGRFLPGQAPKSPGRPAVAKDFRKRCQEFMASSGWDSLLAIASTADDRDRYRALELVAAYAYGKPKQGIELTGEDGAPFGVVILPPVEIPESGSP